MGDYKLFILSKIIKLDCENSQVEGTNGKSEEEAICQVKKVN